LPKCVTNVTMNTVLYNSPIGEYSWIACEISNREIQNILIVVMHNRRTISTISIKGIYIYLRWKLPSPYCPRLEAA